MEILSFKSYIANAIVRARINMPDRCPFRLEQSMLAHKKRQHLGKS